MSKKKKQVPGSRWRLSAYQKGGRERVNLENAGVFDELVVDDWFHMEQMDTRAWWLRLGQSSVFVHIGTDGKLKISRQDGPIFNDVREK